MLAVLCERSCRWVAFLLFLIRLLIVCYFAHTHMCIVDLIQHLYVVLLGLFLKKKNFSDVVVISIFVQWIKHHARVITAISQAKNKIYTTIIIPKETCTCVFFLQNVSHWLKCKKKQTKSFDRFLWAWIWKIKREKLLRWNAQKNQKQQQQQQQQMLN